MHKVESESVFLVFFVMFSALFFPLFIIRKEGIGCSGTSFTSVRINSSAKSKHCSYTFPPPIINTFSSFWQAERASSSEWYTSHPSGITMGMYKGKNFILHSSFAFSTQINRQAFFDEDVFYQQAISFLRKEAITLSPETPKGIVLISYND